MQERARGATGSALPAPGCLLHWPRNCGRIRRAALVLMQSEPKRACFASACCVIREAVLAGGGELSRCWACEDRCSDVL
jgi:hypothetical protein